MIVKANDHIFYVEHSFLSSEKPTMIWLHGMLSSIESDNIVYEHFFSSVKGKYNLIRYDSRSRGKTESCSDWEKMTWKYMANDVLGIADHFGIDKFCLGGTSMGASVSIYTALQAPYRIEKLILNMPTGCWQDRVSLIKSYNRMYELVEDKGVEQIAERLERSLMPDHLSKFDESNIVNYKYLRNLRKDTCLAMIKSSIKSDLPNEALLQSIICDTCILGWNDFPGHPISTARKIQENIKSSSLLFIDSFPEAKNKMLMVL